MVYDLKVPFREINVDFFGEFLQCVGECRRGEEGEDVAFGIDELEEILRG